MMEASTLVGIMVAMFTILLTIGSLIMGRIWSRVDTLQKHVDACESDRANWLKEKFALIERLTERNRA